LSPSASRMPFEIEDFPLPGGPYIRIERPEPTAGPRWSRSSFRQDQMAHRACQLLARHLDVADRLTFDLFAVHRPAARAWPRNIPTAPAHPARAPCPHRSADSPFRRRSWHEACLSPLAGAGLRAMSISSCVIGIGMAMVREMSETRSRFMRKMVLRRMSRIITTFRPVSAIDFGGGPEPERLKPECSFFPKPLLHRPIRRTIDSSTSSHGGAFVFNGQTGGVMWPKKGRAGRELRHEEIG
jgi:hypothetical protein